MRKFLLIVSVVALAVAAVDTATASASLTVCVKTSNGTIRGVSAASACTTNETTHELTTSGDVATQAARISALEAENTALKTRVSALETLLDGVTRSGNTLRFSGLNLQIVNGTGSTDLDLNGLGNLIIGYNVDFGDLRTGSHNLVIGDQHSYTNHSGLVSGFNNTLSGRNAFVGGGVGNAAAGDLSFVGGGLLNMASGFVAFVGGGQKNTASNTGSFVGGGLLNTASGSDAFVAGGGINTASGLGSFVGGGDHKTAGPGLCAWLANANVVPC